MCSPDGGKGGAVGENSEQETLQVLREIRDGQREILALLAEQRTLAAEELRKSQARVEESVSLQKEALRRQKNITRIAVPGILACIAAIAYLVIRYF